MTTEILVGIATTVVGAVIGVLTTYYFFRRGSVRLGLVVHLEERVRIDPSTAGVEVEMRVGPRRVTNLRVLEVSVTNRGPRDLVVPDAADPEQHRLRPRIELPPRIRALADPWNPDGSAAAADIRVARRLESDRQLLHVHVHRLAAGATSRARVLCTDRIEPDEPSVQPLSPGEIRFFPGFYPDVDVTATGLLAPPPALLGT